MEANALLCGEFAFALDPLRQTVGPQLQAAYLYLLCALVLRVALDETLLLPLSRPHAAGVELLTQVREGHAVPQQLPVIAVGGGDAASHVVQPSLLELLVGA